MTESHEPRVEVRKQAAGLFDIRNIIGSLVLIYGVVLVLLGLFSHSDADKIKTDGMNVNLWAGLAMTVLGLFFIAWAYLRPVVVTTTVVEGEPTGEFGQE